MKRVLTAIVVAASLAALAAISTHQYRQSASTDPHQSALQSRLHVVERTLSETQNDLLGYITFTQYLEVTKKAISGRAKFLATNPPLTEMRP
jgi:Tfp pilus assembly protein PilE